MATHGSEEQRRAYLPKMVTGEWAGTMNLTEPDAGSDVGALRTRAERQPDGSYRLTGTKIFISYGDQDLTDNIVHLVLARGSSPTGRPTPFDASRSSTRWASRPAGMQYMFTRPSTSWGAS